MKTTSIAITLIENGIIKREGENMIRVAVDAMGGDFAPKEQVLGAMIAIKNNPDIEIALYGRKEEVEKYLSDSTRIKIVDCRDVIPMGEHDPVHAIRTMTDSSMVRALNAVTNLEADCVCTSGPTQALIVGAHLIVHRIEGFKRTAIAPMIPSMTTGKTVILDCGANVEIRPEYLLQQAQYADIFVREVLGRPNPRIGLMNIGTEEGKGRDFDNECYALLKKSGLNFVGNVETKDILEPPCDILISDGFTTNMVVKTMEGTAKSMGKILKKDISKGFFGKIGALLCYRNLKKFKKEINPDEVAGGMVYGIKYPVVKAHGSSQAYAFSCGIKLAADVVRNKVISKVEEALKNNPVIEPEVKQEDQSGKASA